MAEADPVAFQSRETIFEWRPSLVREQQSQSYLSMLTVKNQDAQLQQANRFSANEINIESPSITYDMFIHVPSRF